MISFTNPAFLFALGGLAIPVLVHLIHNERALPLKFPSIRFIQRARLPQEGKRSIRDWLLLLLRLLFYAGIIIAISGPQWETQSPETALSETTDSAKEIWIIDASASMNGWGSWEHAQSAAIERLQKTDSNTKIGLILFDRDIVSQIEPTENRQLIEDTLWSSLPSYFRGQPVSAIRRANEMAQGEGSTKVVLFSDFQSATWQISQWPSFDPQIDIEFVKVGDFQQPNIGILSAEAFPANGKRIRVLTRIRNYTTDTVEIPVILQTSENEIQQTVELAPQQTQSLAFLIDMPNDLAGRVRLPADTYELDNDYALWLGSLPPLNVLTILPISEEPEKLREVEFLSKALEVRLETSNLQYNLSGSDTSIQLSDTQGNFPIIILPGSAGYLSNLFWDEVHDFLKAGGMVMMTPGKTASKQFRTLREKGISSVAYLGQPGRNRERRTPFRIGWVNPDSPLSRIFDEEAARDLFLTSVYQYVRLRPSDSSQILLKTETGDPLIIREKIGNGTLLISAIAFDTFWTDLPLRNSFLPLLRELLSEAIPADGGIIRLECGANMPAALANSPQLQGRSNSLSEPSVFQAGTRPVEVNVARIESTPQRIILSDLRANLSDVDNRIERSHTGATASSLLANDAEIDDLWTLFAALAALCLLLETGLTTWLEKGNWKPKHA